MLRNQKGFTLIELIIVIVIIGILAAIAVPKFLDLSNSAKISACKQNLSAIESAATIYYADQAVKGTAKWPAGPGLDALTGGGFLDLAVQTCPTDPTKSYTINATGGAICGAGHTIH